MNAGVLLPIGARPVTVGAGNDCELILSDAKVSRRHLELQATARGVRIRDLASTNGSFIGATRISEVMVAQETTIQLGDTTLRVTAGDRVEILPSTRERFGGLAGTSAPMREVFSVLELVSPTDATVIIEGESGTGKELTARALHDHSQRAAGPFVVVDCSAIHEQLIDSQLYGHVKGAFTGAVAARKGAFVQAAGGTLFLDELGELPLPSQAKLLRALEAKTVVPMGTDQPVAVDARVVAATHRDLQRMVDEETFRFDLFYRLAVVHLRLPAVRERPEDIAELVRLFYEGRNVSPGPIAGNNLDELMRYSWPGNVRELRNVLERSWVLSGAQDPPFSQLRLQIRSRKCHKWASNETIDTSLPFKDAKERWLELFERRYLAEVFAKFNGKIGGAAAHAGINRNHFRKLLAKYGLYNE